MNAREIIARRVAREFSPGQVINLGIGIPTLVVGYIDPADHILIQSENGILGMTSLEDGETPDPNVTDSGGRGVKAVEGGVYFNSADSFAMIRGGHVNHTVLGALEVDTKGNIANWMVPGRMVSGMGGAMDLVVGARNVIVAMEHLNKQGGSKIVERCTLPLTAEGVVNKIITDKAVIAVDREKGLTLLETAPGVSVEEVLAMTGAPMAVADEVKTMTFAAEAASC